MRSTILEHLTSLGLVPTPVENLHPKARIPSTDLGLEIRRLGLYGFTVSFDDFICRLRRHGQSWSGCGDNPDQQLMEAVDNYERLNGRIAA